MAGVKQVVNRRGYAWIAALFFCAPLMAAPPESPVPDGSVARAQFTTGIKDREPVDEVLVLHDPVEEVYFFSDLRHLEGRKVTHRWEYQGQVVSQREFEVGGPRWRVYSSKSPQPGQYGEWSVTVVDQSGWPLHTEIFRYQSASGSDDSATVSTGETDSGTADSGAASSLTDGSAPPE